MFVRVAAELGLLETDPNTNILGSFPQAIRRNVVSNISQYLSEAPNMVRLTLNTRAHVNWTMECVAQGFLLSAEEDETQMTQCIEVYRGWLFQSEFTPIPIMEDPDQSFMQKILKHYSLLFQTKAKYPAREFADKHADLCLTVLNIYRTDLKLNSVTWDTLMRLIISVVSSLFQEGVNTIYFNKLISTALKVMFELLLLSHNKQMWNIIEQLESKWVNNDNQIGSLAFIMHWNAVCSALTNRVVSILYGAHSGSSFVVIKTLGDEPSQLKIEESFVCYSWMRALNLIGNPVHLDSSKNFSEAMKGMRNVIRTIVSSPNAPNGNTIIHLVGQWMFEIIKINRSGYEEGTAIAVEILCDIFFKLKSRTQFDGIYLASFYSCLASVLLMDGRVVISCLLCTSNFFSHELPGSNVLLPFFIHAISNILKKKPEQIEPAHISMDTLRESCIHSLGNILSYANHYNSMKLLLHLPREYQTQDGSNLLPQITNYSAKVKPHLSIIIQRILQHETHAGNLKNALSYALVMELEDAQESTNSTDLTQQVIDIILSKAMSWTWTTDVLVVAFRLLRNLASSPRANSKHTHVRVSAVIVGLSKFIHLLDQSSKSMDEMNQLMVGAYRTLTAWVSTNDWMKPEASHAKALFDACSISFEGERKKPLGEAREAKDILVFNALNNAQRGDMSSTLTEDDVIAGLVRDGKGLIEDPYQYVRYYFCHDTIVTTVDNPFSAMGKYLWTTWAAHNPFSYKGNDGTTAREHVECIKHPFQAQVKAVNETHIKEILEYLDRRATPDGIIEQSGKQMNVEEKHLQMEDHITITPPVNSAVEMYGGESKSVTSRAFFNDVGMINTQAQIIMTQLSHNTKKFQEELTALDDISERHTLQVGVVYIGSNQNTEAEILSNKGGPQDYQEFVNGLGWGVDLKNHLGYSGSLDCSPSFTDGQCLPYYADNSFQIIYHVPTLSSKDSTYTLSDSNKNQVLVVWLEDSMSRWDGLYETLFKSNAILLLVHPMKNALYRVKLLNRESPQAVLLNVVVRAAVLSQLVRMTAVDAVSLSRKLSRPYSMRTSVIRDISKKYGKGDTIETLFISGFQSSKQSLRTLPNNVGMTLPSTIASQQQHSQQTMPTRALTGQTSPPAGTPISPHSSIDKRATVSPAGFVQSSPIDQRSSVRLDIRGSLNTMMRSPSGKRFSLAEARTPNK
ncbi:RapGAP/RanGAP domain-containing protein [Planoprotostelium fungivorum]|uniref:RapGAP/RanGAP domain-containing protein n=1 Tax=Planoprotostelium fungivorum TaxID=1890364 RepID=A0A2P6NF20_9EUKA|nr:RapGAP/RanGAP domain-containing protein [Planoprotostelium fungivorum]